MSTDTSAPTQDLVQRIRARLPGMSKKQRIVGEFILQDLRRGLFWSANRIARETGVSLSTVIRFATDLGFRGFPELQAALQCSRFAVTSTVDRWEMARQLHSGERPNEIPVAVWRQHEANLRATLQGLPVEDLVRAGSLIANARHVYVCGGGSAAGLALYFTYNLNLIRPDVHSVADNVAGHLEKMIYAGPDDVLVDLALPRYSYPTVQMAHLAATHGTGVVAITDGLMSPVVPYATVVLPVEVCPAGFHFVYSGVLSTLDALLALVAAHNNEQTRMNLSTWEQVSREYGVYAVETGTRTGRHGVQDSAEANAGKGSKGK